MGVLPSSLPDFLQNAPELTAVIEAWPSLPATLRARILGMVEGAIAARAEG